MDPHMAMPNIPPQAMAPPPAAPPTKAKSRSRSKKNAANSADGAPPTQQPLPPSYQMMGPGSGGPVQNPAMMGQMRPPPHMAGQYEAAYWHQQGQMPHGNFPAGQIPSQGRKKTELLRKGATHVKSFFLEMISLGVKTCLIQGRRIVY
jgi:hypothetical protein